MPRGWRLEAGGSLDVPVRGRAGGRHRGRIADEAPDAGILAVAVELADQALRGLSLTRSAYAGLLSELYEGVRMRMPFRELMDFARATALRAQQDPASRGSGEGDPVAAIVGPASGQRVAG